MARRSIHESSVKTVMLECARRCALCFGLDGDLGKKQGQLAHIDRDGHNSADENLAYFCLDHHDEYDATCSQSRRFTIGELTEYKRRLLEVIEDAILHKPETKPTPEQERRYAIDAHDRRVFRTADEILPERVSLDILARLRSDHSYELSQGRKLDELSNFLATHFFVYQRSETGQVPQLCLLPDLDYDRKGTGDAEEVLRYHQHAERLDRFCADAENAYGEYRLAIKGRLQI